MPNALRLLLRWLARLYLSYLAISLLLVLPLLNILTPRLVAEALGRELRSEIILFNPFTLALEVRGASLHEDTGHQPLALKKLHLDLSLASLWKPGVVLDDFRIASLDVHVLRHADGRFHFADLLESGADADSEASGDLPPITIDDIVIDAHTLRFTDESRPQPFSTVQRDFRLATRNLTTVPGESGDGRLELTADGGGLLRWRGEMDIAGGQSHGVVTLENIDLTHAWRYNTHLLNFVTHSARFDALLDYRVDWAKDLQILLQNSRLRLHDTDIRPAAPDALPHTAIGLVDLALDGLTLDLQSRQLGLATVAVNGLAVSGYDEAGQPSLLELFALPAGDTGSSAATEEPAVPDPQSTDDMPPWQLSVARLSLDDSHIEWRTPFLAPEVMRVAPLRLTVSNVAWPATEASPFSLALTVNEDSALDLSGTLNIGSGDGDGRLSLSGWQLPWLNPLWTEQLRTDISRGTLGFETDFSLGDFQPLRATFAVQMDRFATELHDSGEEAFTLEALSVAGGELDSAAQTVRIAELALERPTGSLHIREDGTINVNGVVRETTAPEEPAAAPASDEPGWRVLLDQLRLRNGRLDFADDSLPLPFKTLVDGIEADVSDLDTASEKPLTAELRGSVDGYAPVLIRGSGTPLSDQRDAKLELSFRGVDIATMSPYSGTYAGYTIDSGTLNLDLRYALAGQSLDGDNRITISQMELGEPVESDLAIAVPLKLGIALLTDSRGVIDLSVPVSGNVDDPEFSLGKVIGRAITNVIVKAVTAPFKLLAGLVGSEDDLENIAFAAGQTVVGADAARSLASLAEALTQRPQLSLRILGSSDPQADGRALREAMLAEVLIADGLSAESITARDAAYQQALGARFEQLTPAAEREAAEDAAPDLATMEDAVLRTMALPANALEDLATQRAAAAKRELVTGNGIDAARIAISSDLSLAAAGVSMRVDS